MTTLYGRFMRSIRWNALESALYHALFLSHQVLLFKIIDPQLYGLSSTILASLYALVMIGNLGLDATFGPFFHQAKASQSSFKKIIFYQLGIQVAIFAACSLALVAYGLRPGSILAHYTTLKIILACTLMSEGIKKSARTLLQLAFLNHLTTIIEVCTILAYMILVWGWYGLTGSISLISLLLPLLITSCLTNSILFTFLYRWYRQLPTFDSSVTDYGALYKRIIKSRCLATIYSVGQQIFSSNILIPTIALQAGLVQAGLFNLVASIASSITSIFHKIGGYTTQAILSHIKDHELSVKKEAFAFITSELLHIIGAICIFIAINSRKIFHLNRELLTTDQWLIPAYIYLAIILCDYLVIAYEKFYLNEERADFLALFNIATIMACFVLLYFSRSSSPTILLGAVLMIRAINLLCLALLSHYYWGIKPRLTVRPWYAATIIFCSLLFFIIF